jgi:hypothetical protein
MPASELLDGSAERTSSQSIYMRNSNNSRITAAAAA